MSRRASERCANEWLASSAGIKAAIERDVVDSILRREQEQRMSSASEVGTFLLALCFLLGLWAGWMVGRFLP